MNNYNAEEYLDTLVTVELSARFAVVEGRPLNKSIKDCWKTIRYKVTNDLNRKIFDGLSKQPFPAGALAMMRRQLDEAVSE